MKKVAALCAFGALALSLTAGTALASSHPLPFSSSGSGTEMSLSPTGCQFTVAGCTVESSGTAVSTHLGRGSYTSTLTIDWAEATSNGNGGYCAPASGPATLTAANGDTLNFFDTGAVCEVGPTGNNVPHTFSGTYTITGGTGRFTGASGSGTIAGGDDGQGNSYYTDSGTIAY